MSVFAAFQLAGLFGDLINHIRDWKYRKEYHAERNYKPETYAPIIQQPKLKINKLTLRIVEINWNSAVHLTGCYVPVPAHTTSVSGIFQPDYDLRINGNEIPKRGVYS